MKPKYPSYNQQQLKYISDQLCDRIEDLLAVLHVDYKIYDKMITMACPIHGGDNMGACNLYYVGDSYRGNWKCRTHNCEEVFKSSIIGFIRGCLSHRRFKWESSNDKTCSFGETMQFVSQFLGNNINMDSLPKLDAKTQDKNNFVNSIRYITETTKNLEDNKITKDYLVSKIEIPSKYFIERGFSKTILSNYYVGECKDPSKEMYQRAVVPIFDDSGEYVIGCSGRSIFEKCTKCKFHHPQNSECPSQAELWKYSKWRHSAGFRSGDYVYNIWNAKTHIAKNNTVILVESPGNVWRLEEAGIHNAVAIFGTSFSDRQKMILDCSGAMNIITIMDNDDAGKQAQEKIYLKCRRTYNVSHINISVNDVASMSIEDIKQLNINNKE